MRQFAESFNNISFNILGTKEKLNSIMNLNFSVNLLPQNDMVDMHLDDDISDQASIADKIELKD